MAKNRMGRINEGIQRELASLLRTVKDPRVKDTMLSITRVETTGDLHYAKIYVSALEKGREQDAIRGLRSASGYLRHELGARLQLRYTPELMFEADDSIARGSHILEVLRAMEQKDEEKGEKGS